MFAGLAAWNANRLISLLNQFCVLGHILKDDFNIFQHSVTATIVSSICWDYSVYIVYFSSDTSVPKARQNCPICIEMSQFGFYSV